MYSLGKEEAKIDCCSEIKKEIKEKEKKKRDIYWRGDEER